LELQLRDRAFAKQFRDSSSPGGIAEELGMTREGVYMLVRRGRLDAIRIVGDRKPHKLHAYLITRESVARYRATRYQHGLQKRA